MAWYPVQNRLFILFWDWEIGSRQRGMELNVITREVKRSEKSVNSDEVSPSRHCQDRNDIIENQFHPALAGPNSKINYPPFENSLEKK